MESKDPFSPLRELRIKVSSTIENLFRHGLRRATVDEDTLPLAMVKI